MGMIEIIVFIIIISVISNKTKRNRNSSRQTPPIVVSPAPKKPALSQSEVNRRVNQQIFHTENPKDRVTLYNRFLLTDRYQNMEKIAHELGISKHRVLREIQALKKEGHYQNIEIDEENYRLIYPPLERKQTSGSRPKTQSRPAQASVAPKRVEVKTMEQERTFVEPSKPYRPARNAGQRHEDWMPVPEGKQVVQCHYCGAKNLLPRGTNSRQYTCYFCREEL